MDKLKKLIIGSLACSLILSGCGSKDSNKAGNDDVETEEKAIGQAGPTVVTDPIEFITMKDVVLNDTESGASYKIVKVFKNTSSDKDGFNNIDNDGFVNNLAFALVQNTEDNTLGLGYFGEMRNNTEKHIEFLGGIEFTTNTGEQLRPEGGVFTQGNKLIKDYNPNVKSKGFGIVPLEYQDEKPSSIDVLIEQPHNNDDTDTWGEDVTIKDLK